MGCNTSESIIMTRRPPTTETRIDLRTILSAGVLAVLACAGAHKLSGEVVQLTGAQTTSIVWNTSNFEGFCYDLGDAS